MSAQDIGWLSRGGAGAPAAPSIVGVLLALTVMLGCATTSEQAVHDLRVCTKTSFDEEAGECDRDERGEPLVSSQIFCSMEFNDGKGKHWTVEMRFSGQRVNSDEGTVDRDNGSVYVAAGGNQPIPSGDMSCRLAVGDDSLAASFRTDG
jgi:hypothetical protein